MIDVDYNEYKETLAENMKLIRENHDLKERLSIYESDSDTVIMVKEKWEETKKEIERLNNIINELESWLISWIENEQYCFMANNPKDRCRREIYEEVLHRFKELKGSVSNE